MDPLFGEQWYLYMPGIPESQRADIRAFDAWQITQGSSNIKIAVIESDNAQFDHPDLSGRVIIHNEVSELYNGFIDVGKHELKFEAGHLSSGFYIVNLIVKNDPTKSETIKLLLLK